MPTESFARLTGRLSAASVHRRWEAHRDVDWSAPAHEIDAEDPRWQLPTWDPIGASAWYRDQAAERRSRLGLWRVVAFLKAGIAFEAALGQGLLRFAATLPDGHPAFRYVHHEVTEEAQHSMMFQEVVNRAGLGVPPLPEAVRARGEDLVRAVDESPAQFFLMAASGEEAFDHVQRRVLAERSAPPLLRRIYRIHVTEEARHLSFARGFLRHAVPRLSERDRRLLRLRAPFMVEWTATHIVGPEPLVGWLAAAGDLPPEARREIVHGPVAAELRRRSAARSAALCRALGLVDRRLASVWADLGGE